MGEFAPMHILLVLAIVLLFFGPSRLPALGKSICKTIRGFKEGMSELDQSVAKELKTVNDPITTTAMKDVTRKADEVTHTTIN